MSTMTAVDNETVKSRAERGRDLQEAVEARRPDGLTAARLARDAGFVEQTYYAAVRGEAADRTYDALEAALAEWDEHPEDRKRHPESIVLKPDLSAVVEIEMVGVRGVDRVFVRGPVGDVEAIRVAVQAVMDGARTETD